MGFSSLQQPSATYQPSTISNWNAPVPSQTDIAYQAPVTPAGPSGAVFNNNGYNWNLANVEGYKPPPPPVAPVRPTAIDNTNPFGNLFNNPFYPRYAGEEDTRSNRGYSPVQQSADTGYLDDGTYVGVEAATKYNADLAAYNEAKAAWDDGTPTIALNPRGYVDPGVRAVKVDPRAGEIYRPTSADTSTYNWGIPGTPSNPAAFAPKGQSPAQYGTPQTQPGSIVPQFNVDQFIQTMLSPPVQAAAAGTTPGLFVPQQAMGAVSK